MRSIGKVNKRKLLKIIKEEIEKMNIDLYSYSGIRYRELEANIENRIPESWYDIWEGAYTEIENLISDVLCNYSHRQVIEY